MNILVFCVFVLSFMITVLNLIKIFGISFFGNNTILAYDSYTSDGKLAYPCFLFQIGYWSIELNLFTNF